MKVIHNLIETKIEGCVATIGFFDGVHAGHRYLIEQVKSTARTKGLSSMLITFPVHPRKIMNSDYQPELLSTPKEKAELLEQTGADYCVMLDFTPQLSHLTASEFMLQILKDRFNVQCLIIGYDHRFGRNRSEGFDEYLAYGKTIGMEVMRAKACILEDINVSSSAVRLLLQNGDVSKANLCLGYEYYLDGTVVDGYKVGRHLGFPTANLKVEDPDKLVPLDGVYAVKVTVEEQEHIGMLYIGNRPTINNGKNKTIEVNIINFDADIYDRFMRITFVKRVRPDMKFGSKEKLIEQLHKDREAVIEIFNRL